MSNLYKRLLGILPSEPRDKGQVIAVNPDGATVELVTGARVRVRGDAQVGDHVFIRGRQIEGPAPALSGVDQTV
ncbi:hypothetical protein GCM10011533_30480 [Streptosporangium jomthongense]|uniref:Uncharacterized protein n=1 Tax=Marinobacter aromaticivorans TaxID=1494078 RepID=A0ABW2IY00_9GAMM|nr:hypothetical protein [Marinobacter aromaticivorans]GGE75998.1 hypothetical protein GCM10011533_30480 [Streptosporangium jomthongense]